MKELVTFLPFLLLGCSEHYLVEKLREGVIPGDCIDRADNDADGDFDCEDEDCWGSPDCFDDSDLEETDLEETDLEETDLEETDLEETDLEETDLEETDWGVSPSAPLVWVIGERDGFYLDRNGSIVRFCPSWGCTPNSPSPPIGTRFVYVDTSSSGYGPYSCALNQNGQITCWGNGPSAPYGDFKALAMAAEGACGLTSAGDVVCWGMGPSIRSSYLSTNAPQATDFVALDGGYDWACGLRASGYMYCWSANGWSSPPSERISSMRNGVALTTSGCLLPWNLTVSPPQRAPTPSCTGIVQDYDGSLGRYVSVDTQGDYSFWSSNSSSPRPLFASFPAPTRVVSIRASSEGFCRLTESGEIQCSGFFAYLSGYPTPQPQGWEGISVQTDWLP